MVLPWLDSGNLAQINHIGQKGAGTEPPGNSAQPEEPQDSRSSGSESRQPPTPEPPLILLAEDDPTNYLPILDYLSAKGYRVALARDGTEALQSAESLHPAMILMDIWMPGMDGLEAIRRLRSHTDRDLASCPIIAVTAMVMRGDEERCLEAGANAYMPKPISLKSLLKTIRTLLDEAKTT